MGMTGRGLDCDGDQRRFPFRAAVELEVFSRMVANFKEHRKLLRDDVTALSCVFDGVQVQGVFELLDDDCVTVLRSHLTKRLLVEVHSKMGSDKYYVPPGDSLCQCRAYLRGIKNYCKHVLAAHFYLGVSSSDEYKDVAESEMDALLKSVFGPGGSNSSVNRR